MIRNATSIRLALQLSALILFVAASSGYIGWRIGSNRTPPGPPPVKSIEETLSELTKELSLTDDQVLRIRPILEKRERLAAMQAQNIAGRMNAFAEEMRTALDERQRAIFDERTREIRAKAQQRRPRPGPEVDHEENPKK